MTPLSVSTLPASDLESQFGCRVLRKTPKINGFLVEMFSHRHWIGRMGLAKNKAGCTRQTRDNKHDVHQ